MVRARPSGDRRRWSFGNCTFDEASWSLTVDGQRIRVERKPLELLRQLLIRAGEVVSKQELLDKTWGAVTVVESSLPTAIRKLRRACGDGQESQRYIETVPGIGYRFAAPVECFDPTPPGVEHIGTRRTAPLALILTSGAIVLALALLLLRPSPQQLASAPRKYTDTEIMNVLRDLNVEKVEQMIAEGWDAKTLLGSEKNDSLNYVLGICEWNPDHDRQKMMVMVRTLIEAGARVDRRNVWGDTAYSIAKAPRYCGPEHPVTRMFRRMCAEGTKPLGDRCMASYELARGEHFAAEREAR